MIIKRFTAAMVAVLALGAGAAHADWPERPVTIVVPFAAGQTGDMIARMVGKELETRFGKAFIVENRPGSGGRIGTTYAARAKPDGYTLLMTSTGPYAITPALYPNDTKYDPLKDFVGIAETASTPQVIAVSNASGIASFSDLVKRAKAKDLSYGSAGNGSLQHLTMELLKKEIGFPMVHVPFKGSAESKTALIANTLEVTSDSLPPLLTSIKANQIKAVAVVDNKRSAYIPDVPTLGELGYPKLSAVAFFGLVAPQGTPREVVQAINREVIAMFKTPAFQEQMQAQALTAPTERTPEQFSAYLAEEVGRWKKVVEQANVTVD
ncbi:Bug family tripartite tricarboxylate transporter substrate binding protein [Achromobacter aloeverae]|uniref:Tripartite tricarboxylate transporter substrate binding protein n=1 Tax=Achromobacter aloeverae TaxID=1750518 RepID=A0A4Q1HLL4_9BURK|nr:tripartite tricarboxylate transporter substrate binding protein [Achromobacter aloeverae]RXN91146.1 tripartite tricarboxylate transporter substrate binding protein [Achromobacter aloeverae]